MRFSYVDLLNPKYSKEQKKTGSCRKALAVRAQDLIIRSHRLSCSTKDFLALINGSGRKVLLLRSLKLREIIASQSQNT